MFLPGHLCAKRKFTPGSIHEAQILKITPEGEPGKMIRVIASVTDKQGNPVAGALVYLYQTDSKGWYAAGALM